MMPESLNGSILSRKKVAPGRPLVVCVTGVWEGDCVGFHTRTCGVKSHQNNELWQHGFPRSSQMAVSLKGLQCQAQAGCWPLLSKHDSAKVSCSLTVDGDVDFTGQCPAEMPSYPRKPSLPLSSSNQRLPFSTLRPFPILCQEVGDLQSWFQVSQVLGC